MPRALKFAGVAMVGIACSSAGDDRDKDAAEDHDIADSPVYGDASPPMDSTVDVHDANDATLPDADASDGD